MSSFFALVSACAKREDILLQIFDGCISVYVGSGPERVTMAAGCGNEEKCREILHEITEGKYSAGKARALHKKTAQPVRLYGNSASECSVFSPGSGVGHGRSRRI